MPLAMAGGAEQDEGRGVWVERLPEWMSRDLSEDEVYRSRCLLASFLERQGFRHIHIAQILYPGRKPNVARVQVYRMLNDVESALGEDGMRIGGIVDGSPLE